MVFKNCVTNYFGSMFVDSINLRLQPIRCDYTRSTNATFLSAIVVLESESKNRRSSVSITKIVLILLFLGIIKLFTYFSFF